MFNFKKKQKSPYWGSNGVKGLKDEKIPETKRIIFLIGIILITLIAIIMSIVILVKQKQNKVSIATAEISRSMEYDKVEKGEESVEGTENVKFDAFFLRDLDEDGYAEGIRGTCKEVGKEDTLYMELNVQTAGVLKDAKITVNGQNFYLQTALPKDEQLKNNYIGNNTKTIEFNDISSGTQKLITGIVRSGDYTYSSAKTQAIGNDTTKYSKSNNEVTLSGKYVDETGEEIEINKTVQFTIDWYGTTKASMSATSQTQQLESAIDNEKQTFTMNFNISTQETMQQLLLSKLNVTGTIPELNGYRPTQVRLIGSTDLFTYDEQTETFMIEKTATTDENGIIISSISRYNTYKLQVVYPLEAYKSIGEGEEITLKIPVQAYYEGYNNPNSQFQNPYKSNVAKSTIVMYFRNPQGSKSNFDITVGEYISSPYGRYVIKKKKPLNIYNGKSTSESNDTYLVRWYAYIGTTDSTEGLILKESDTDKFIKNNGEEESMKGITTYKGIYFGNITNMLGEDGYIRVYNDETDELIETFDKTNVNKYSSNKPYYYETSVKRVRIETSNTTNDSSLYIYHVKELDDEAITEKYTKDEFDNLQYIKSTLNAKIGNAVLKEISHRANYEASASIANISISESILSIQETKQDFKINIQTKMDDSNNIEGWKNGAFLVKLPDEILYAEITDVKVNNGNAKITNYELIEQDGKKFIKILTENETVSSYNIEISLNITPDPRSATTTGTIELYASNENATGYYYSGQDIYDVNNNLNTTEQINKRTINISLIAPSSLLTNQTASNYDDKGGMIISPQVAEIRPQIASVDQEMEEKTANIGITIRNNYSNTISDIIILGKIPFEGNTYVLTGNELNSEFTTKMSKEGIQLPEQVANIAKVYYSENTNPSKDLLDETNAWKTAEQVENWDKIKTFLIDLSEYSMPRGEEMVFNYTIKIPNGVEYNKVSYSHHGVYFSLDTAEGKYPTQTQPNRIGFKIVEKYDLQLRKYQKDKDKLVTGATYRVIEEGSSEGKTGVTDTDGILNISGLYVERTYIIEEIGTPEDYELNTEKIKFIGHMENGKLTIEILEGNTRNDVNVEKKDEEQYKALFNVEDEIKAKLKITKLDSETSKAIAVVKFKIVGEGLPADGQIVTTDLKGIAELKGLKLNTSYDLIETKANGYYLSEQIKFKITNNGGTYNLEILRGSVKENGIVEEENIPVANVTIEDKKIPTYSLEVIKIKKIVDASNSTKDTTGTTEEKTYLKGAKFKLFKDDKEIGNFETNENGKFTIENLYKYVSLRDEKAIYTLKETYAPDGYAKVKDITFRVEAENSTLKFINIDGNEAKYTVNGDMVSLTIEDSPSFKLIKQDDETGQAIANVKFAIYNTDNGEVPATNGKGEILGTKEIINGKEYYVLLTDQNGMITADLPEGSYKAVELEAPNKYDISNSVYYFGIGGSVKGEKKYKVDWTKVIDAQINTLINTSDGGYIAGGYFSCDSLDLGDGVVLTSNGGSDGLIVKYSANGEIEWAKAIGGNGEDNINSIIKTKDGGYIVVEKFSSTSIDLGDGKVLNNNGNLDLIIIKYNADGEIKWAKVIGGNDEDNINSVTETIDGGYIVGGEFYSTSIELENGITLINSGRANGMLIKYNADGEIKWAKAIGGDNVETITSIKETVDRGYIVTGEFQSNEINLENGKVLTKNNELDNKMAIKYNENGEVEWAISTGGKTDLITETTDRGYIVISSESIDLGNGTTLINSAKEKMIIKYKSSGEIEWAKKISFGWNYSISQTTDRGYILHGQMTAGGDAGDGIVISGNGYIDSFIIKYNENGKTEWAKAIGGNDSDYLAGMVMQDGGYLVVGNTYSRSVNLENGVTLISNGSTDGVLIRYSSNGELEWARAIGGNSRDEIGPMQETTDGGWILAGNFSSENINLGDGITISKDSSDRGMIIKWSPIDLPTIKTNDTKVIGGSSNDDISSIYKTKDGGYIVGGSFESSEIKLENGTILTNNGDTDVKLIKYDSKGEMVWARAIGGSDYEEINFVVETADGEYLVVVFSESENINLGNGIILNNDGNPSEVIIKYDANGEVEWAKEVEENENYWINSVVPTTDGGYIATGQLFSDKINFGNGIILNNNGASDGILIKYNSDEEVEWAKAIGGEDDDWINIATQTADGGYIIKAYFNSKKADLGNGIVLNDNNFIGNILIKYDANGNTKWTRTIEIQGYMSSIAGTEDGGYVIGGEFYNNTDLGNGITLTNNGSSDGMIIKYNENGKAEWAKAIGGSNEDYINSVVQTTDGNYIIGGYFNSESINLEDGITLKNNGEYDGMLLKIYAQEEATETQELIVKNKRKEYKITTEVQETNGTKGGSISGKNANPYETVKYGDKNTEEIIKLIKEQKEIIKITINGKEHKFTANEDGTYTMPTFENITEDKHIVVTYALKDNKIIINKVDSITKQPLTGAKFKLENLEDKSIIEIETNSEGQAITQIPFGKYTITETQAPEGYELNENTKEIEFTADGIHEFTIENTKLSKVIVHHYIKGTNTKIADDEEYTGKIGEKYTTLPKLDIVGYTLEKDSEGNYIIPENAIGEFKTETQEIIYYYESQKVKLTVHHYIEGTETPVPLKDGGKAADIIKEGEKGEEYTTEAIEADDLGEDYVLIQMPENATGTYQDQEIIVTYYYAQKTGRVITHHYIKGTTTQISKDVEQVLAVGKTYETKVAEDIPQYYELTQIPSNNTGKVTEEDIEVIYYYQPKKYQYTVEYYFENIKDENLTENLTAEYGNTINTYKDKVKPKYHFDKLENLPLKITTDPELNVIKIYYKKNYYDITTEIEGEGGSISGQGEQPYETVLAKYDSTKDIIVTPDKGYTVEKITINGDEVQYSKNTDGTVKLATFKNMMEDKHIVASFRKILTIIKQGEEEATLLPGAKFVIKNEAGEEINVATTDEDGRIDIDLRPGKYTVTEIEAPENYILPENEEDRTYTIEVKFEREEKKVLERNWINKIKLPKDKSEPIILSLDSVEDESAFSTAKISKDKGLLLFGGVNYEYLIGAEDTEQNQPMYFNAIGIQDGLILHINEKGKVKFAKQIKSASNNDANKILDAISISENEYIAVGIFMGTIEIPVEETINNESIAINTDSNEVKRFIIKYNSDGKVEWLTKIEMELVNDWILLEETNENEFVLLTQFKHFEATEENTASEEKIVLDAKDSQNGGTILIKYNKEGKIKSAKQQIVGENIEGVNYYSWTDTDDGGYIRTGSINKTISIPAEETTDGKEINIEVNTDVDNNLGNYGAVLIKFNIEGKIEYIKKIEDTNINTKILTLGYVDSIKDGYLGIIEYYDIESKETRNALVKFNSNLDILKMLDLEETKVTDQITIKEMSDGSYTIFNAGTQELANYREIIVQKEKVADAPTLIVKNEAKKYEYKVEYYYDGEIDETQTEILEEKYGKTVEKYKDKIKENYVLQKTENLPLTITNELEKNVIKIYYAKKAEATVQYIDKTTGKIMEEKTEKGYVGKEFKTEAKDFENYILVEEPEEKTVKMQEEKIVLKYYYVKISSGVIEKHIDIKSGEILYNTTYKGLVGDSYSTQEKEFDGYDLVKEKYPENANGNMTDEVITVTYYYIKNVTITVQYVDIDTNEKIEKDITIKGHEGDEYNTEQKEIEQYEYVKVTEDKEGIMTEDKTIIYYYKKIVTPDPLPEPEPENPDKPAAEEETKTTESSKNKDTTIADIIIPGAGINKLAMVLGIVTIILIVFTIISYNKYKKAEMEYKKLREENEKRKKEL